MFLNIIIVFILLRILAKRLEDLEKRFRAINQGETVLSPSSILLHGCELTSDETDIETSSIDG